MFWSCYTWPGTSPASLWIPLGNNPGLPSNGYTGGVLSVSHEPERTSASEALCEQNVPERTSLLLHEIVFEPKASFEAQSSTPICRMAIRRDYV